jgi:hypothetical protein
MAKLIEPYGAGTFFPADTETLRTQVRRLLRCTTPPQCLPKAIIVPHAGYDYSGPIAAASYACLTGEADTIRRVLLLGTSHVARSSRLLTTTADAFVTPLDQVPIDRAAVEQAARLPQVSMDDDAHRADHALAVQLPMLQSTLRDFRVVPFLVGRCDSAEVDEVLELLWGGEETLVVVSSDLSHHLNYDEARQRDRQTADSIVRLDADASGRGDACGYRAITGLLRAARKHHLRSRVTDLRNSGDTSSRRDYVVGYGAFIFEPDDGNDP